MTKVVTIIGTFMLALAAVLFVPKAMAQETVTITLTPDECVKYTTIVYQINSLEQLNEDPAQLIFPGLQNTTREERTYFIRWLLWIASTGRGLTPLAHAQAFLSVCSMTPVGELTIPLNLN